jgi:outer membrane lipoprotein carrier protein
VAALCGGAATAPPGPGDARSAARLLEAALNDLTGLVASFTQTVASPGLPSPQVERGTLYLLRPGRMRWEYDEPRGKLAIADGRRSYLYLPDEGRVLVGPLAGPEADAGVALLLSPSVALIDGFEVEWGPRPEPGGAPPLKLTPRVPRPQYRHLLIEPDEEHLIRALTVVDPLGGTVTYRFDRTRRADRLPANLFRFTQPAGVEVQEMAP